MFAEDVWRNKCPRDTAVGAAHRPEEEGFDKPSSAGQDVAQHERSASASAGDPAVEPVALARIDEDVDHAAAALEF